MPSFVVTYGRGQHRQTGRAARFLRALAQVSGHLCSYTQLGGQVGIDGKTASRYTRIRTDVPAQASRGLGRTGSAASCAKMQFIDAGLLAMLAAVSPGADAGPRRFGALRNLRLRRTPQACGGIDDEYTLHYYRDHDQYEVDFVIENAAGDIVGVKRRHPQRQKAICAAQATGRPGGKRFRLGVIL